MTTVLIIILLCGASVGVACIRRRTRAQALAAAVVATVAAGYLVVLVSVAASALS